MYIDRDRAAQLGREAVQIIQDGAYQASNGRVVELRDAIAQARAHTQTYPPERETPPVAPGQRATQITVTSETTLEAASRLVAAGLRPLALNFASAPANGAVILSTDSPVIGLSDGATNRFTLTKTWGGFTEPVGYLDSASLQVYVNGVPTPANDPVNPWSLATPNSLIFNVPPAAHQVITASYTWYYRVRFGEDAQDYDNFLWQLWELKKLTLEMAKP